MPDPRTIWLTITNVLLGVLVVLALLGMACAILCEIRLRYKKRQAWRRELEGDLDRLFHRGHLQK